MTPFEAVIASKLIEQGYEVLTSGWPDFCVVKRTENSVEVRFIEVKGRGDALRPSQKKLHAILKILGIEVEMIQEDAAHRMQYPPALASGIRVTRHHLSGRPPIVAQKAITFLEAELKDGPQTARSLLWKCLDGRVCGRATLYRTAKDKQVVRTIRAGEVVWELPVRQTEEQTL